MPIVNVPPQTYEALARIAASRGTGVEDALEVAVGLLLSSEEMTDADYQRAWDDLLAEVRANVPPELTPGEIEADIDAATDEVWAERRARGR